ncbi:MAG: LysR family transcriptional regulator [Pseudohongiellaceae bacterium]
MPMQLRGLRTFCLAAHHLSFKKAADELCLSASAVSHQISDLEDELGTRLFERHTRSISLTAQGSQFYEELRSHLDAIEAAATRMKKNAGRVPLLVQMPEFFASELLMPIISDFSDRHQDIDLRIESMDSSGDANPGADINIVLSRHRPAAAVVEKLFPIRYIPACSKSLHADWLRKGFTSLDAINVSTILLHKARPHAWTRWARHAGIGNMRPKQIIFVDSMFALARAAQQSAGIALVPMPVSKAWFDSGELVPLHSTALTTEDYYWMTRNDESCATEAADVFWRWIGENLQQYADTMDELNSSVA